MIPALFPPDPSASSFDPADGGCRKLRSLHIRQAAVAPGQANHRQPGKPCAYPARWSFRTGSAGEVLSTGQARSRM